MLPTSRVRAKGAASSAARAGRRGRGRCRERPLGALCESVEPPASSSVPGRYPPPTIHGLVARAPALARPAPGLLAGHEAYLPDGTGRLEPEADRTELDAGARRGVTLDADVRHVAAADRHLSAALGGHLGRAGADADLAARNDRELAAEGVPVLPKHELAIRIAACRLPSACATPTGFVLPANELTAGRAEGRAGGAPPTSLTRLRTGRWRARRNARRGWRSSGAGRRHA